MSQTFDDWFKTLGKPKTIEEELPEGVFEGLDKKGNLAYFAYCKNCECSYELFCDPEEFTPEYSYCGGSQYCIP